MERHSGMYPTSLLTYKGYADLMRKGATLYPHHKQGADLTIKLEGCEVCANGALIAGLSPEKFEERINEHRSHLFEYREIEIKGVESIEDDLLFHIERLSDSYILEATGEDHPLLWDEAVSCPVEGFVTMPVEDMIIHLYDSHNWSIEEVATWLEGLDNE